MEPTTMVCAYCGKTFTVTEEELREAPEPILECKDCRVKQDGQRS